MQKEPKHDSDSRGKYGSGVKGKGGGACILHLLFRLPIFYSIALVSWRRFATCIIDTLGGTEVLCFKQHRPAALAR